MVSEFHTLAEASGGSVVGSLSFGLPRDGSRVVRLNPSVELIDASS